jgi:hypothetical protein
MAVGKVLCGWNPDAMIIPLLFWDVFAIAATAFLGRSRTSGPAQRHFRDYEWQNLEERVRKLEANAALDTRIAALESQTAERLIAKTLYRLTDRPVRRLE